ncbi:MAG: metallophosphoesterase family protein [Rhodocyclaceae bacterium]
MKICILSDSHDHSPLVRRAAEEACSAGAELFLHCGDVIGAHTLESLVETGLPVHVVHGNNLGDPVAMANLVARSRGMLTYHGADADLRLDGRRVFVVHYPHYGRAMAGTGDFDLVCCGHSHKAEIVRLPNLKGGETLMVNPGTVAGLAAAPTYALGDLGTLSFEIRRLA